MSYDIQLTSTFCFLASSSDNPDSQKHIIVNLIKVSIACLNKEWVDSLKEYQKSLKLFELNFYYEVI